MPNYFLRISQLLPITLFAVVLFVLCDGRANAQVLWYNGDPNNVTSIYSTDNSSTTENTAIAYDDFKVTGTGTWQVSGLFGDFLFANSATLPTTANWYILSGVSAGNGGTVVASGTSAIISASLGIYPTNTSYTSYQIAVTGLTDLDLGPGTYWLGIQPISSTSDAGYLQTTSGINAVGTPPGNDGNAFWSQTSQLDPETDAYFESTTAIKSTLSDFSLGVTGEVVPEPSTWALTFAGVGLVVIRGLRSRRARA
jgi:hypothetical protein